jgi:hypothetical protein
MDQDEKTARGHARVPVVRATPPVGTPLSPHAPTPPAPAPSASQPRTVGGHTARLLDEDLLLIDPLGSSSVPFDPDLAMGTSPPSPGLGDPPPNAGLTALGDPPSQTLGGTARLLTVSPEDAAAAKRELDEKAPDGDPVPIHEDTPSAHAAPRPAAPRHGADDDDEPSFFSRLFAPLSVGVGLVFFAMGSMLELTIDGRANMIRAQGAASALAAPPPQRAPSATATLTAPPAVSTASVALPPPSAASASVAPASSLAPTGKPAVSSGPSGSANRPQGGQSGGPKGKGLIF